nr:PREDICTED: basic salivary proline-rich protein 2-like isoform X1 [Lepisosteus oculatus]
MPFDSPAGAPPSGSLLPDASQGYVEVPVAFQSPPREESEGYPQVPPAGPPTGDLPMDPPPAYSPSPFAPPPAGGSALLLKQVGDYCFLPDPSGKDWDTADTPGCPSTQEAGPPGKAAQGKAQALALIGDSPYVRLAQPGCREQDWGPLELWGAPPVETGPKGRRILPERTGRTPAGGGGPGRAPPPCPTLPMSSGPPLH